MCLLVFRFLLCGISCLINYGPENESMDFYLLHQKNPLQGRVKKLQGLMRNVKEKTAATEHYVKSLDTWKNILGDAYRVANFLQMKILINDMKFCRIAWN